MQTSDDTTERTPLLRRPVRLLVAFLTLALPLVVLGTASPAHAAYCGTSTVSRTHPDGVTKVKVTINRYCAGATYVTIQLSDTKCDARSALVELGNVGTWQNSDGCGTTRTWSFGANSSHGMPNSGTIKVCQWAANSTGRSSISCYNQYVPPR